MERIVIVGYKPLPGKESALIALAKTHWETLNSEGLVSQRQPVLVQSSDSTVIEVFGWKSKEAMETAHSNPVVLEMWEEYSSVCEYASLKNIKEFESLFAEFTPVF